MTIPALDDKRFKHLTFVVDSSPEIMSGTIYLYETFVQMPLPLSPGAWPIGAALPNLGREHRAESVPPETNRLMAEIDATFMEQIFDVSKRQRNSDIHRHRKAVDLGQCLGIAKWIFSFGENIA